MTTPPPETQYVSRTTVSCDGDEGPLGHPRVYIDLSRTGRAECPYCDRLFILGTAPQKETA